MVAQLDERGAVVVRQHGTAYDGTLGQRSARRVLLDGSDGSSSPADARALAALRLGAPRQEAPDPYDPYRSHHGYGRRAPRAIGVWIDPAVLDRIVPAVAASGRLGWLEPAADRSAELRALRWDGDVPFRIRLVMRGTDRGMSATASLVRASEDVAMPALAAMFGGGCAAIGDRLIRIEDGAELARWWAEDTVEDEILELQDRKRALLEARARHPRRSGSARRMGVRDPRHVLGNTARDDRGVGRRRGGMRPAPDQGRRHSAVAGAAGAAKRSAWGAWAVFQ